MIVAVTVAFLIGLTIGAFGSLIYGWLSDTYVRYSKTGVRGYRDPCGAGCTVPKQRHPELVVNVNIDQIEERLIERMRHDSRLRNMDHNPREVVQR